MKVFDVSYAKRMAKGYDLKVTLKKTYKGTCLFSKKPIKKGSVVAYYKFMIYKDDDDFKSVKNRMYAMTIYTKSGRINHNLIGDIYEGSLEPPRYNIPFWGYFSNEPSRDKQEENVYLDMNLKENYRKRDRVKAGETMVYKLIASRDISPTEEIMWCYGGDYGRDYVSNC